MSADFVNNGEINMDDVETLSRFLHILGVGKCKAPDIIWIYAVRHKCDQSKPEAFTLY